MYPKPSILRSVLGVCMKPPLAPRSDLSVFELSQTVVVGSFTTMDPKSISDVFKGLESGNRDPVDDLLDVTDIVSLRCFTQN